VTATATATAQDSTRIGAHSKRASETVGQFALRRERQSAAAGAMGPVTLAGALILQNAEKTKSDPDYNIR
jgi:hypothetical protein